MRSGARPHEGRHRGLGELLPFDEARARLIAVARPVTRTQAVPVASAQGRVAAETVRSGIDVPVANLAARDGYAVRAADTAGAREGNPVVLHCVERVFAGSIARERVRSGACIQIATGAMVPPGADAVVMVEDTDRTGDDVRVYAAVRPRENVSARGEDIRKGGPVVTRRDVLTPAKIGALIAIGRTRIAIYRKPRVAVLTTGSEVVAPGKRLRPGQVYDVNAYTIGGVVRDHGGEPVFLGRVRDDPQALRRALGRALSCDIVVVSGGTSVGERDLLGSALREMGRVLFHGVAVKPGRPTLLARVRGKPVVGMPGFVTSCLSNAYVLLAPAVRAMAHLPPNAPRVVEVPLASPIVSPKGRTEFHTVRLEGGKAIPAFKESSAITSMAYADGYIEIPPDVERLGAGETVRVILF